MYSCSPPTILCVFRVPDCRHAHRLQFQGNRFSTPSLTSGKKMFAMIEHFLTNSYYNNSMFGKAKCKLCGDDVRFALRHLKQKHPEVLADKDVATLNMSRVIEKYFD